MKAALDEGAVAVAHAAAGEEAKPILTCVRIGDGEIVAADGFLLARRELKTEGEGAIMVPAKAILKGQKICPDRSHLVLEESNGDVVLKSVDPRPWAKEFITLQTKVVEGSYPGFQNLYPTSEPVGFIALSPGLLRKILDIATDASLIKFRIRKSTDPVEFVAGETSGLIMPMWTPEEDEHWHKVEPIDCREEIVRLRKRSRNKGA